MYVKKIELVATKGVEQLNYPYSKPTDYYDKLPSMSPARAALSDRVSLLKLTTDEGVKGYVETSEVAGRTALSLAWAIEGLRTSQTSLALDLLYRLTLPTGRTGIFLHAISALELLMWDSRCKELGVSCLSLIGGPTREKVRAYASHLHPKPIQELKREARNYLEQGFTAMKMRFPSGPWDALGVERNEEVVRAVREEVGKEVLLAADAWMSWNLNFSLKMLRRLEKYELAWIEEPLLPDDLEGYRELASRTGVPLAAGEHHYHVYDFKRLLDVGVTIVQPDALWSGGLETLRKVASIAEAYGAWVIPHTSNVYNLHFAFAEPENIVPMVEYLPHYRWMENFAINPPLPERGFFFEPKGKGFCVEYDVEEKTT
ncbi:hypothetical protein HS1genome_1314 [Sulfodiicoccus acidiphilus]|uniref:Mandelate racemase/muconate lactonizing enzyme C-terminal domain-containing protein n=1 Tax=Sulfodiicoccus acidiphilus TaxID=1670455 RepID=A0A348B423_9CREN|nr:enolase C-terminal domain-like protein [Sulfodiicoccus acidiphilus]BBD72925.1 hypothetical protein HS1genome_1314 [Sulfodiicoccus acidiphilus]GGT87957.1 hypothetical protein GCM10007116_02380 [Sulfodiicoccus acidiphilus]